MGKTSAQRGETDTGLVPQRPQSGACGKSGHQGREGHPLPRTPSSVSTPTTGPLKTHWRQAQMLPVARGQQMGTKFLAQKQTDVWDLPR